MQNYDKSFYINHEEGSRLSAEVIIPLILKLIRPKQVVDVGCGMGTWLSVFKEYGVEDIWGIDGDWVDKEILQIPKDNFLIFDLKNPIKIDRRFDLVLSVEVAEHLPKECAEIFIDTLTNLGSVILFSAAIPFQGGTHHINEQWQDYWANLFRERKFVAIDSIRKKIWQNNNVEWWYAQNILMFVEEKHLKDYPLLETEFKKTSTFQLSMVHPNKYLELISSLHSIYMQLDKEIKNKTCR